MRLPLINGLSSAPQRILVTSTPKTGNTWLRHLLAATYQLPIREVGPIFCEADFDRLGRRWIAQQHFLPTCDLVQWAQANEVVFVTTIRHPADVLVSWCHYATDFAGDKTLQKALEQDGSQIGGHVASYVREKFFLVLNGSISWIRSGLSHVVRYEDLWRDPATVLRNLTQALGPVPEDAIERAIVRCDFDHMRQTAGEGDRRFFRKGGIGGWRDALPPAIVEILTAEEPFPSQFSVLGYTMDPADTGPEVPMRSQAGRNPFHEIPQFDNGVPVRPILVDLYLSLPPEVTRRWPNLSSTDPEESFFAWANAPSARAGDAVPLLSNLAVHILQVRPDLHDEIPSLEGWLRTAYIRWFLNNARDDYNLPDEFIRPMAESFQKWSAAPAEPDGRAALPIVTNFGAYVYSIRPDLRSAFPDLYGRHRVDFSNWFIHTAPQEYGVGREQIIPVVLSWAEAGLAAPEEAPPWESTVEAIPQEMFEGH
jgi:hypothetical protein